MTDKLKELLVEKVAQGWCEEPNRSKQFDGDLAIAIVNLLLPALQAELDTLLKAAEAVTLQELQSDLIFRLEKREPFYGAWDTQKDIVDEVIRDFSPTASLVLEWLIAKAHIAGLEEAMHLAIQEGETPESEGGNMIRHDACDNVRLLIKWRIDKLRRAAVGATDAAGSSQSGEGETQ